QLQQRQRVVPEVGERLIEDVPVEVGVLGIAGAGPQQFGQVGHRQRAHGGSFLFVVCCHDSARSTISALKPPYPRASTSAAATGTRRGAPRTRSISMPGASCPTFTVGGMAPSLMDSAAAARSSGAPPEYSRPVIVFGAVTGTAPGPKTALIASASDRSSAGTPAASANTTSMSAGRRPASASASCTARRSAGPRPVAGAGSNVLA